MKEFRYRPSANVPYDRQGAVWFTVRRYHDLPKEKKQRVNKLLYRAAGHNCEALLAYIITDKTAKEVAKEHYIGSTTTLTNAIKKLMEIFPDDLL